MKLKEILDKSTQFLKEKKFDSPRLDAELLLANSLGLKRIDLYLKFDQPLADSELEKCRSALRRRISGEPVAYILGVKDFYQLTFQVNKSVLIPRPETELLVDEVLRLIRLKDMQDQDLQILDLGTGSGCIGLSLINELPNAKCTLVDISDQALVVAAINSEKFSLQDRTEMICADAANLEIIGKKFDIIVANPPYIGAEDTRVEREVKDFEPSTALFSAENGLESIKTWSKNFAKHLKSPGIMAFEFGIDQGPSVREHFFNLGVFSEINVIKDLSGLDRHLIAITHSET